mmetsp:Transcript_43618/g.78283  ORF Transcript_43618/g.78283 Transcript_43618/m.78283 type:complete len:150 (-) Transcript_43618:329-778(-)
MLPQLRKEDCQRPLSAQFRIEARYHPSRGEECIDPLIACDVDPIELVLWLPALCRKMEVPFLIVKDKARLGTLVHQKTAAVVALTGVNKEDEAKLKIFQELGLEKFNKNAELMRKWGGGIMGLKTQAKLDKRAKAVAAEDAKKAASLKR